jgi:hypothetical protein
MSGPFVFCTQQQLVLLTGRRAKNIQELLDHVRSVPGASIFYHTHYLYLTQHFVTPRFYNEFAGWVSQALLERRLAERIGAIDLLSVYSLREMRERIANEIERHLQESPGVLRDCPPGEEFHFCEAKSFVYPNGLVAHSVSEFFRMLPSISNACLHFHIFESRLRLEKPTNDFSVWLTSIGERGLAAAIDRLNPYVVSLDELKGQIFRIGRRHIRKST